MAVAALMAFLAAWGVVVEPRAVDVELHDAPIPDLPSEWEGRRVAFLSDLQVAMWLANEDTARRMFEELERERPSLVLLGGDFVYGRSPDPVRQVRTVVELLRPLPAASERLERPRR
ncbi:MAG: metallophosphoesterase [Actinomycetota bacterium]|nr:metallophosphoesterase [Actinomycetota bacterium]